MKKKIVIASVLKPIDDVRAYWKLSLSIAKTNKYEVNTIGNKGKIDADKKSINFHPHSLNRDNWLKRIIIRELILFKILKIKPDLLIITTHELIVVALLAKLLTSCKVVYDVQENYSLNLSAIQPSFARKVMASLVYMKEKYSRHFIDQYWLAEKSYQEELSFLKSKSVIAENKALSHPFAQRKSSPIHMLFSGTVSEYGGVKRTVTIFKKIQSVASDTSLTIIGQVHDPALENWLQDEAKNNVGLMLNISKSPIPYHEILQAIAQAHLGVIGYEPNQVNKEKIPTKLYEYSRYHLPYLVQENTKWSAVGAQLGGAIPIHFTLEKTENILKTLRNQSDLFPVEYPKDATWENEFTQIIQSVERLIE